MDELLEKANAHLSRALAQALPSYDRVIADHIRAARKLLNKVEAAVKARRGEETGWVIERADSEPSRPMYFTGKNWDYDNLKAVRFARKEDVQTMSRYMFPGEPHRIANHMWCP
jgi:hypothetical protein